jgi:hypothetical protein
MPMPVHSPPAANGFQVSRESFHLETAKIAYLKGVLTIEEYETAVEHVLRGGTLDQFGRIKQLQLSRLATSAKH